MRPRLLTTIDHPELHATERFAVDYVDRLLPPRALVAQIVRRATAADVLLLDGSVRSDQAALALLGLRRLRRPIVVADATWSRDEPLLERTALAVGIRLIELARPVYCVLSRPELERFPRTWPVDPARVVYTPFHVTLSPADLDAPLVPGAGVFAGGDSLRDYGPLIAAAAELGVPTRIATRLPLGPVPPPVEAGPVPPEAFVDAMRQAAVVVVPLAAATERSAGQQTYLNAMALGKLVVATDSPGARDYLEDGVTAVVVPPGDAPALGDALRWAFAPEHRAEVEAMRARGAEAARTRFTTAAYVDALLDVLARATGS